MLVPYIIVIDNFGCAIEEKFKQEADSLSKVGEPITTFCNEIFSFYNVSGLKNDNNESLLVIDNKLQIISYDMIVEKIRENVAKLINQAYNSDSIDLLSDSRSDSLLKCATDGFKKYYDLDIQLYKEDFSAKKYKDIQNELIIYSNVSNDTLFINKFLSALNTVMAMDESIAFEGGARFLTYTDENEKKHLNYSVASQRFADMQNNSYTREKMNLKIFP